MRRLLKTTGAVAATLALLAAAAAGWIWLELDASLPIYDGELTLEGLAAPVVVERDALGVATIRSEHPRDEARALGFVHAEERFFQMDLLRRRGAGELAALFGPAVVGLDERARVHLLRETAEAVVREASEEYRRLLEAYAEGVNAGLAALGTKPFEYWLLRAEPAPWVPADSVLVGGAMYFDLQGDHGIRKRNQLVARSVLPAALADFVYPASTAWDAPVIGEPGPPASVPPAEVYDLRALPRGLFADTIDLVRDRAAAGSNNWALAGSRTATGRALLANDPHLSHSVPSIWFRTSLVRGAERVAGVSLPGWPQIVIGSNGRIAWGFTNTEGDWNELIVLEVDPNDAGRYRTPEGWRTFETVASPIEVAGAPTLEFSVRRTIFGPVLGELPDGRPYAVHWVAHDPRGYVISGLTELARADNVAQAISIAQRSGIPAQNLVVADAAGDVGWTIMGAIPRRTRASGISRSSEGSSWHGWLEPDEYPRVVSPPQGRVWTANGRVGNAEMADKIGTCCYALGARAGQIRDRLMAIEAATPEDMLRVQLDDEAWLLADWRDRLLELLDGATDPLYIAAREAVRGWGGHAAVDSVGYRLVRGWRLTLIDLMGRALFAEVAATDPGWTYDEFREEHWARALVSEEPPHLLDPRFESWRAFELAALDRLLGEFLDVSTPEELARRTWGDFNTVLVRHPLSRAAPWLGRWLDMPPLPLPGDGLMPRVQNPGFGASMRLAVSPGDEANGLLHMPGGQSGHPLSPYFGAGHADWAAGRPAPFLPGPAERTLLLSPDSQVAD